MYWQSILNEVANKNTPGQHFSFTDVGGKYCDDVQKRKARKYKRGRAQSNKIYRVDDRFPQVYFTRREAECMVQLLKGKTIIEASRAMSLSHRTVEAYVKSMRTKLGCASKSELVTTVHDTQFCINYFLEKMND